MGESYCSLVLRSPEIEFMITQNHQAMAQLALLLDSCRTLESILHSLGLEAHPSLLEHCRQGRCVNRRVAATLPVQSKTAWSRLIA